MSTTTIPTWTLGDRLAKALDISNVTVQEMADELGVSRTTVSNYMHGRTHPSRSVGRIWALRTGVPFAWLITGNTDIDGNNGAAIARYTGGLLYDQGLLLAEVA